MDDIWKVVIGGMLSVGGGIIGGFINDKRITKKELFKEEKLCLLSFYECSVKSSNYCSEVFSYLTTIGFVIENIDREKINEYHTLIDTFDLILSYNKTKILILFDEMTIVNKNLYYDALKMRTHTYNILTILKKEVHDAESMLELTMKVQEHNANAEKFKESKVEFEDEFKRVLK